jgi:DNA-binding transcriptional MocR family regulator
MAVEITRRDLSAAALRREAARSRNAKAARRMLLDTEDRVVMEDPGYDLVRQVFLAAGAEVVPVAVDREGMRTDGLPATRLAYVTPSHQFPLGGVLSAGRRRDLLSWAQRIGAYVVEDDYDSEYRFDIAPDRRRRLPRSARPARANPASPNRLYRLTQRWAVRSGSDASLATRVSGASCSRCGRSFW